MSIRYTVSALQWIDDFAPTEPVPGLPPNITRVLPRVPSRTADQDRRNRIVRILGWRMRLVEKYRSQLDEDLVWNEESDVYEFEQPSPGPLLMLALVAATLECNGPEAVHALRGSPPPPNQKIVPLLLEANRRGFGGLFPQWLLGASYWLPFRRNMIIEDQNWREEIQRYGSVFQLNNEITRLRSSIAIADPSAHAWPSNRDPSDADALAAAWQASTSILRLSAAATARNLPLWIDQ